MNQDLPAQAVPPRAELEISLAEVLAPLRRHSRLILVGTAACWAILLLLYLFAPPRYSCEATLVLPDVIPAEASGVDRLLGGLLDVMSDGRSGIEPMMSGRQSGIEPTMSGERSGIEQARVGIPPVLYKKLERSLSGGAGHVSPVTSGTKDDIQKLEKGDTISAVTLSHESYAANQSRDAVNTLAGLVRETLITAIAMEQIESEAMHSRKEALDLFRRKVDLLATNRSLEKLTADLERLARDMPESRAASREVVDTREGGYRFLPPQLQIVGAKARYADNEHMIRLLDRALSLHALRLRFLDRLQQRILGTGTPAVSDLPQVIGSELQEFLREEGPRSPDSPYVQTEMEALRDKLAAFQSNTRFIQYPTTRAESRASLAAALASLAVVVFIAAAFVADLWQRAGGGPNIEDASVSSRSA